MLEGNAFERLESADIWNHQLSIVTNLPLQCGVVPATILFLYFFRIFVSNLKYFVTLQCILQGVKDILAQLLYEKKTIFRGSAFVSSELFYRKGSKGCSTHVGQSSGRV